MKKILLITTMLLSFGSFAQDCGCDKKDIVDTAIEAGNFKTLVQAVSAAGLVETLRGEGPFTVFAPTDDAFAKLPSGLLETLLADPTGQLKDILLYHVASGSVPAKDVLGLSNVTTVFGQDVSIEKRVDGLYLNESKVVMTDIKTSNGIIHVIDAVLVP